MLSIIIILIGVIVLISSVITIVYVDIKKREKDVTQTPCVITYDEDDEENKEYVTLIAAKRLNGSAVNGYETNLEFRERVSKLSKKEFLALGLEINPNDERDKSIIYAYDTKGKVNKKNYELLTRIFNCNKSYR